MGTLKEEKFQELADFRNFGYFRNTKWSANEELIQDLEVQVLPPDDDGFDFQNNAALTHFVPALSKKMILNTFFRTRRILQNIASLKRP